MATSSKFKFRISNFIFRFHFMRHLALPRNRPHEEKLARIKSNLHKRFTLLLIRLLRRDDESKETLWAHELRCHSFHWLFAPNLNELKTRVDVEGNWKVKSDFSRRTLSLKELEIVDCLFGISWTSRVDFDAYHLIEHRFSLSFTTSHHAEITFPILDSSSISSVFQIWSICRVSFDIPYMWHGNWKETQCGWRRELKLEVELLLTLEVWKRPSRKIRKWKKKFEVSWVDEKFQFCCFFDILDSTKTRNYVGCHREV